MRLHLEGMGLQGSLLAHTLARYSVTFTWHDIDAPCTAWKASTGAIYPADSTTHGPDREAWKVWAAWYDNHYFSPDHLEKSLGMVFSTKKPPHDGKYGFEPLFPGINLGHDASYHFNAQLFVPATRERFNHTRRSDGSGADMTIVTHGWGQRLDHVYWGWTRLVKLDYTALFMGHVPLRSTRPAFYFRHPRVKGDTYSGMMTYAYPVPGTPYWYAGSSILKQAKDNMKDLDPLPKYERWKAAFERVSRTTVAEEGDFITGWRPAAAEDDTAWVRRKGNIITLRPLWNSGIRHWPAQWAGIAPQLGLIA